MHRYRGLGHAYYRSRSGIHRRRVGRYLCRFRPPAHPTSRGRKPPCRVRPPHSSSTVRPPSSVRPS
ncbi:hypothetical protein DDE05_58060, partial [Streptomyces cavourensis]